MSEDSLPKFFRVATKIIQIMLEDPHVSIDVDVAREVDARSDFYDVLNSSFVASSSEHLMDRVAKMSLPGEQAWIYLLSWSYLNAYSWVPVEAQK